MHHLWNKCLSSIIKRRSGKAVEHYILGCEFSNTKWAKQCSIGVQFHCIVFMQEKNCILLQIVWKKCLPHKPKNRNGEQAIFPSSNSAIHHLYQTYFRSLWNIWTPQPHFAMITTHNLSDYHNKQWFTAQDCKDYIPCVLALGYLLKEYPLLPRRSSWQRAVSSNRSDLTNFTWNTSMDAMCYIDLHCCCKQDLIWMYHKSHSNSWEWLSLKRKNNRKKCKITNISQKIFLQ
jgi:hypothetical protein